MAYMNNWLGFSLSPQEHQNPQDHSQNSVSRLGFNTDKISGTDVSSDQCFDLTSDSTVLPSLNLPAPFGILEAFNRNNTHSHSQGPKLENFLGSHSFAHHGHYMYQPLEAAETATATTNNNGATNNNIGLSMIKNWLRNQPTPTPAQPENKNDQGCGVEGSNGNLSLSMSTESQTGSPLHLLAVSGGGSGGGESSISLDSKQKGTSLDAQTGAIEAVPRKSIDTFGQRTSIYRGVTRHRWTGRYEAHLWDNSCRREGQTRKGRQGGYDKEEKAARAYDLAALKYWGTTTTTNFPIGNYEKEIEEMKHMTRQEYVASLRRKSSGFSRGASIYRGVTRHHQHGRWQARIGRVAGNKDLYLGTFSTQEEAAEAYDIAAIKFRGLNAVTNFDMSRYDVKSILESSTLPIGGAAKRLKDAEQAEMSMDTQQIRTTDEGITTSHLTDYGTTLHNWPTIAFQQAQPFSMHYPYGQQRMWCKQEQDEIPPHTFQDLNQIQLGNTHNFFQSNNNVLHNLMSLDSASLDHSSGSNSGTYSNGVGDGGYVMPIATVISQEGNNTQGHSGFGDNEVKAYGYETVFGSSDAYHGRNLYYLPQQSQGCAGKVASVYDQGSMCNNWVPTAVPTLAPRANNMALCHGAQTFTVWNDT
ncbi:integrase-type DNA-binding superfamily protein [Actinidia rufa]|uniref:Integrase-type DNA-binding superfamily protein n=1 Tax=Actinidia rufa TaxID=165716 RepID=A0A7J0GKS0_9ERIC|nr:integrase-type DNA-binding superfamily protein [Actinidia rufa]